MGERVTEYGVKIVRDDDLPGHDWVFINADTGPIFVLTESACMSAKALSQAWAAWRTIFSEPHLIPTGKPNLRSVS